MRSTHTHGGTRLTPAGVALLWGVMAVPALSQGTISAPEPNDSIPTAVDTGFTPGSSGVKVAYGHTGDGPYGEDGDGTGDVDFYKVSVNAGQVIMINMANAGIDPDFDPFAAIYDANGEVVASNDDKGNTSRGYDRTPRIVFEAPEAGDYYICVSNWVDGTDNLPYDPMTPGSGPGLPSGTAGPYQLIIAIDAEVPVPQFVGGNTGYPVPAFLPSKVLGTSRYDGVLTIRNLSAGTTPSSNLVITGYNITGPNADRFFVRGLPLPVTIPPGGEINVNVAFNGGGMSGKAEAQLEFTSNDPLNLAYTLDTSSSPVIGGGNFTVRQIDVPSEVSVTNWGTIDDILNDNLEIEGINETVISAPGVNFGGGNDGRYGGDFAYPSGTRDPNNSILVVTGTIRVREPGVYTFYGYSDDGQRLSVDGEWLGEYTDYNTDHFYPVELTAGEHTIEFIVFEGGGANHAELAISQEPGTFTNRMQTTWELLEAVGVDSDSDGLPDEWEIANGLNANSAAGNDGANGDPDGDGVTNINEYFLGTNPQLADTDGDGLNDGVETGTGNWVSPTNTGTNPLVADSDGDGLLDSQENLSQPNGSDPNRFDTDGDGFADGVELALGSNPQDANSKPELNFSNIVLAEDFDSTSVHSHYAFTRTSGNFTPGVYESEAGRPGNTAWLLEQGIDWTVTSIAWDQVKFSAKTGVQLSLDFRLTPLEGDPNPPADGFGIGLFRTANYGESGPINPGAGPPYWENPTSSNGFSNGLVYGMTVYTSDVARLAGPAAPTTALVNVSGPFNYDNQVFNRVIITVLPNSNNTSLVKVELIEDVDGEAIHHLIADNVVVRDFSIADESFRIIAGGRTGAYTLRAEIDNVTLATSEAATPVLAFSRGSNSFLASIFDGTNRAVNPNSVQVTLNGTPLAATVTKDGSTTLVSYTSPTGFFQSGTNTVVFTYADGLGQTYTDTHTFTTDYKVLPSSIALPLDTGATSGFAVRPVQVQPINPDETSLSRLDYAEGLLAGNYNGSPFEGGNVANLAGSVDGVFTVDVINFDQDGNNAGLISGDTLFPGIPGITGRTDTFTSEIKTWIEFPAPGMYRFGVVGDDGIRVSYTHGPVPGMSIVTPASAARTLAVMPSIANTAAGGISGPYPEPPIVAKVVLVEPAIAADADQRSIITNAAALAGNVALIERGTSSFSYKVKAAQEAGAIAAIIINQTVPDGMPIIMGGDGVDITGVTIPAVMISRADGDELKALIASPTGLEVKFGPDTTTTLAATDLNTTTYFNVAVPQAGLYPIRLVHFEGGGAAHLEWFTVDEAGQPHLLNDRSDAAALRTYATVNTSAVPPSINITQSGATITVTFTGTLEYSDDLVTWLPVTGATSPYTIPAGSPTARYYRAR